MEKDAAGLESGLGEQGIAGNESGGAPPGEIIADGGEDISAVRALHLPVFEYARGRVLAHFVLTLRNQVGVIEELSNVLTRSKVNILSGFHVAPVGSDGTWSFFVDVTDATLSPDELAKEFSRSPNVLDVKFRVSRVGFIADMFHFPPRFVGPILVISAASLKEMFRHIRELLGTGSVGDILIHQLGIANGRGIGQSIASVFGKRPSRGELEEFFHLLRAAGWGVETLKEFDYETSTARVQVANCTECSFYSQASQPQSQFVRGSYEAQFTAIFGKPVDVEEVLCTAKGDSICEFVVKPR